jgi:hypothetical protein
MPSYTVTDGEDTTVTGVGLGRKKKGCQGKGICVIGSDFKIPTPDDRQTIARLSFTDQSLSSMFITYSDLSETAMKEFFSDRYFIMEEVFSESLEVKGNVYKIDIPKGKFPISKQDKGLKIQFD